jgi:hypothetical protein
MRPDHVRTFVPFTLYSGRSRRRIAYRSHQWKRASRAAAAVIDARREGPNTMTSTALSPCVPGRQKAVSSGTSRPWRSMRKPHRPPGRRPGRRYRRAIEAHRQAFRPARGGSAMSKLSRRAFPEPDVVAGDAPASIEAPRAQRRGHRGRRPAPCEPSGPAEVQRSARGVGLGSAVVHSLNASSTALNSGTPPT